MIFVNGKHRSQHERGLIIACVIVLLVVGVIQAQDTTVTLELIVNQWPQPVIDNIQAAVARFEEANPGIQVSVARRPASSFDDLVVRVATGIPPDVQAVSNYVVAGLAESGTLMPLDDLIDRAGLWDRLQPDSWRFTQWDGNTWAVPSLEAGPRVGMVWNKDFVEEAGLSINPHSAPDWETFFTDVDKLTVIDAEGHVLRPGFDPLNGQNTRLLPFGAMWNTTWIDSETSVPQLDSDAYIEGLELLVDRVFARYPSYVPTNDWYAIAQGHVAGTILGIYGPGEIRTANPDVNIMLSWPPHVERKKVQQLYGWSLAVPAGARDPQLSMKLIEFIATDVDFQVELFQTAGYLGTGLELYQVLPGVIDDANVFWYVQSMADADSIIAHPPHPLLSRAEALFNEARNSIFDLDTPVRAAMESANQQLTAEMQEWQSQ